MHRDENSNNNKGIKNPIVANDIINDIDNVIDAAEEASSLLGAGLGRRELEAVVGLLDSGLKPTVNAFFSFIFLRKKKE